MLNKRIGGKYLSTVLNFLSSVPLMQFLKNSKQYRIENQCTLMILMVLELHVGKISWKFLSLRYFLSLPVCQISHNIKRMTGDDTVFLLASYVAI